MASYKQPCIHCGGYIERDARFCPLCSSYSPFGYLCPTCLRPIEKEQKICSGCGRSLYVVCPHCGMKTFVGDKCEHCKQSLMIQCQNSRCNAYQFFQNEKCTACGKRMIKNKNK